MEGRFVFFVAVGALIEEGVELEVLVDGDGIVFMRVALRTGHRGTHKDGEGCVHAVDDRGVAELFIIGTAFVLGHRVAMKRGGDELVVRRVRQ